MREKERSLEEEMHFSHTYPLPKKWILQLLLKSVEQRWIPTWLLIVDGLEMNNNHFQTLKKVCKMCFPSFLLISRVVCFYVTFANELQVAELVTSLIVLTKCPAEKLQEDRVHFVLEVWGHCLSWWGGEDMAETWGSCSYCIHAREDRQTERCTCVHRHTHTLTLTLGVVVGDTHAQFTFSFYLVCPQTML